MNDFVLDNENRNKRIKLRTILDSLHFLMVHNDIREMNTILPAIELDNLQCKLFVGVRQKNEEEYERPY